MSAAVHLTARHTWPRDATRYVPGCEAPNGLDRTERACRRCGLVKITMHPPHGLAWRRWRTREGVEMDLSTTPPCLPAAGPDSDA